MQAPQQDEELASMLPKTASADNVKVVLRIRPLGEANLDRCLRPNAISIEDTVEFMSQPQSRNFTFDRVCDEAATQESLYQSVGREMVEGCLSGYNGTVFAYGQTGSGKTYTMQGPIVDHRQPGTMCNKHLRGLIPRVFEHLFSMASRLERTSGDGKEFLFHCSYLEIYNEHITDLLDPSSAHGLQIREDTQRGVYVENLSQHAATCPEEMYQLLLKGACQRHVAETAMNKESSRSHSLFTVWIESKETHEDGLVSRTMSRLNLVDLAGSERQKETQAAGQRLREAGSINKSLSCLGQVINALAEVANGKHRHVHYRDSKLTFLLKDSLGGNSWTTLIACVSPSEHAFGESLSTLKFAQRAKSVKQKAVVNQDYSGTVSALQEELVRLKNELLNMHKKQNLQRQEKIAASPRRLLSPMKSPHAVQSPGAAEVSYMSRYYDKRIEELEGIVCHLSERLQNVDEDSEKSLQKMEMLTSLVEQKENLIQCTRLALKLREAHIEHLMTGDMNVSFEDGHVLEAIDDVLHPYRNPEVTRFAIENLELREQLQLYHSHCPEFETDYVVLNSKIEQLTAVNGAIHAQLAAVVDEKHQLAAAVKEMREHRSENAQPTTQSSEDGKALLAILSNDEESEYIKDMDTSTRAELVKWKARAVFHQELESAFAKAAEATKRASELELKNKQLERERKDWELRAETLAASAGSAAESEKAAVTKYNERIGELNDELTSTQESISNLSAEVATLTKEREESERMVALLRAENESLLTDHQSEVVDLRAEIRRLTDNKAVDDERLLQAENSVTAKDEELERMHEKISDALEQNETLSEELSFHKNKIVQLEARISEMTVAAEQLQSELEQSQADQEVLKTQLEEASSEGASAVQQLREEVMDARKSLKASADLVVKTEKALQDEVSSRKGVESQLAESRGSLSSMQASYNELQESSQADRKKIQELKSRIADLEQQQSDASEYAKRLTDMDEEFAERESALQHEITALRDEKQKLSDALYDEKSDFKMHEEKLTGKKKRLKKEVKSLQEKLDASVAGRLTAEKQVQSLKEQLENRNKDDSDLMQQLDSERSRAENLDEQNHRLKQVADKLQRSIDEKNSEISQALNDLGGLRQRVAELESTTQELSKTKSELLSAQRELSKANALKDDISTLNAELQSSRDRCMIVEKSMRASECEVERLRNEERRSYEAEQDALARVSSLEETVTSLSGNIESLKSENAELARQNSKLIGHQNTKQKIQLHVRIKEENNQLKADRLKLLHKLDKYQAEVERLHKKQGTESTIQFDDDNKENCDENGIGGYVSELMNGFKHKLEELDTFCRTAPPQPKTPKARRTRSNSNATKEAEKASDSHVHDVVDKKQAIKMITDVLTDMYDNYHLGL